jgi:predicted enzyme related to lactoylglutathione lyase
MIANRSALGGDIVPGLVYTDVAKAIEWLCDVFGFSERLRAADEDGTVGHAQLAIGQGGVMLGPSRKGQGFASAPDDAELRPPRPNEVSQDLTVHVDDVDRHYEHAKKRGARILSPPTTCPFGERQYTAEDLERHRWTFSQSVADVAPEDWGAKVSQIKSPGQTLPRPRWCYMEVPAADVHQSAAFYEKVFGWNIRNRESDRPSFDDATGQVSGAFVTRLEIARKPGLLLYIWVDSIDEILIRVAANGGKVAEGRTSIGGDTFIGAFRDPAGNLIGLYEEG